MNCQAFRNTWLTNTDSELLSHIETCEACIAWIESQTQDEEVQFLKEVPLPPANLEERIMQAIYQTSEQGVPPHAATIPLQDTAPTVTKKGKQRFKGFPSLAWVSAAAVLIAVGVVGYQQMQNPMVETAFEAVSNQQDAPNSTEMATAQQPAASPAARTASPEMAKEQPATTSGVEAPQTATANEQLAVPYGIAATDPEAKIAENPEPTTNTNHLLAADTTRSVTKESRPPIIARNSSPKPAADQAAKKDQPPVTEEVNTAASIVEEPSPEMSVAAAVMKAPVYALTVAPEEETGTMMMDAADNKSTVVGPPAPAAESTPITLSTFTDVETAVQASDMPVPVFSELPDGFTLSGISIRYESETSQKVAQVMAEFQNATNWIKVEVTRNGNGKRSLSIPGTFTATQLFSVNNEQAIGVSFEKQSEQTTQHAVHFNAESGDQSLYVVMTAHGISLEGLMEVAKKITWKP